jgi:myo-inositol-1(or 4)-monophosphatase
MHRADDPADPSADEIAGLRSLAAELARDAGSIAVRRTPRRDEAVDLASSTKSSQTDIVTELRPRAEARHRRRPPRRASRRRDRRRGGHERRRHLRHRAGYIDPIDGTTNFVYDLPGWACRSPSSTTTGASPGRCTSPRSASSSRRPRPGRHLDGRPLTAAHPSRPRPGARRHRASATTRRRREQAAVVASLIGDVRDIRRSARPRSTCACSPPAGSTCTTRQASDRGTWRPAS